MFYFFCSSFSIIIVERVNQNIYHIANVDCTHVGSVTTPLKKGGLSHLSPKFEHIFVAVKTIFPLSSVKILLLLACCLLCVL